MKKKQPTRITSDLTTTTFSEIVAADLGVTPKEAYETVVVVFSAVARANAAGFKVALTNFGTFLPYFTKRRNGRNPQTGETVTVAARQAVKFRVSPTLADAVRRRDRKASIRKQPKGAVKAAE